MNNLPMCAPEVKGLYTSKLYPTARSHRLREGAAGERDDREGNDSSPSCCLKGLLVHFGATSQ